MLLYSGNLWVAVMRCAVGLLLAGLGSLAFGDVYVASVVLAGTHLKLER